MNKIKDNTVVMLSIAILFGTAFIIGISDIDNFLENIIITIIMLLISIYGTVNFLRIIKSTDNAWNIKKENAEPENIIVKRICTKCDSENISYQSIANTRTVRHGRGCLYWLVIGWWLEIILWLFLTIPRLLILIFSSGRRKTITTHQTIAVCQDCGNSFNI